MELDTLIAEIGADAVARFRRPLMDRAQAERLLSQLVASQPAVHPTRPVPAPTVRASPRSRAAPGDAPRRSMESPTPPDDSADRSGRVGALRAAARRVTGGHRPVRARPARGLDTVEQVIDPFLDQQRSMDRRGGKRPVPHSALLRPPSRPLPRVSMNSAPPTPEPAPDSPTRAAMGALFDDDNSTDGLVFLGDPPDAGSGFAPRPGTDPAIAPLPTKVAAHGTSADLEGIERTADELEAPIHGLDLSEAGLPAPDEPQLAGAEAPMPMDVPAAPFGFGPGDAEPTRVDRRSAISSPPERHAPAHLSEEVVVSSVRKLFRR